MGQLVFYGGIAAFIITAIYISGRKKSGFVKHFSRGDFMRDLNKKMEGKAP